MDVKLKLYCNIKGMRCYDWTLYADSPSWSLEHNKHKDRLVVVSQGILNKLTSDTPRFLDDTFVPKHGDQIHLVSGCPVGVADVRKNYVLKRKPDDGVCNVFSPLNKNYSGLWPTEYAIVPSEKAIVLSFKNPYTTNRMDIYEALQHFFPDKWKVKPLGPVVPGADIYHGDPDFVYLEVPEAYLALLRGDLKKPCISYRKLEFKTDNEVNQDILYLVYKTGIQKWSQDAEKAFNIQLCALNEHNWRDYPGTVSTLFNDLLRTRHGSYCLDNLGAKSRLPKAAKEMVSYCTHTDLPFKSEQDLAMAQKLVKYIVGIPDNIQFSNMEEMFTKFKEKNVDINCFYRLFDNIVKFKPKVFKQNES